MDNNYDIGIIGGGPAGYAAAVRASQKGLSVVLFEKDCVGGVCLNRGCIPTKVILRCSDMFRSLKKADKFGICVENASLDYEKVFNHKNDVVQKIKNNLRKLILSYDVQIVDACAKIIAENQIEAESQIYNCKNIIIATGAKPVVLKGLESDGNFILNSDELLCKSELPQNILIIGSGAIGVEWARIFAAQGKNVTVVELAQSLLPSADETVSQRLERLFKRDKIKFYKGCQVEIIKQTADSSNVTPYLIQGHKVCGDDNHFDIKADMILCAAGRVPVLPEIENVKINLNGQFIDTDNNFKTNIDSIFAAGDVNGKIQLAHAATHQALAIIDYIVDKKEAHFDVDRIPSVIYGSPEIAWVGKTEADLCCHSREGGNRTDFATPHQVRGDNAFQYKSSTFPVAALGKAQADDEIDGFIKVLSVDNKIVGAHIISPEASSLVQQFALMIDNEIEIDKIKETVFAHPTYSEGVFEAVLGLDNLSLSLPVLSP